MHLPQMSSPSYWKDSSKGKREAILDLSKYVNERIRVKFTGGREGKHFINIIDHQLIASLTSHRNPQGIRSIAQPCTR